MNPHSVDSASYVYFVDGKLEDIISTWVDDLLYGGTDRFHKEVIAKLKGKFEFGEENSNDNIEYVRLDLKQKKGKNGTLWMALGQKGYAEKLRGIDLGDQGTKLKAAAHGLRTRKPTTRCSTPRRLPRR